MPFQPGVPAVTFFFVIDTGQDDRLDDRALTAKRKGNPVMPDGKAGSDPEAIADRKERLFVSRLDNSERFHDRSVRRWLDADQQRSFVDDWSTCSVMQAGAR